jgi:hypothetical protein
MRFVGLHRGENNWGKNLHGAKQRGEALGTVSDAEKCYHE